MISEQGLRNRDSAERSRDGLGSYLARYPNLREDFILIARQNEAGDVVVITVGDIARDDFKGPTSDVSLRS
jgi:hypothetical protein